MTSNRSERWLSGGRPTLGVDGARWDDELGEFVLSYELVRTAPDPDAVLRDFLQRTYEAAATTAGWDRQALERPDGGIHDG